jgi:DMSO reductase family type II enzyme chaperone
MDDAAQIISLARSSLYKVVANAFAYPTEERRAFMSGSSYEESFDAAQSVLSEAYRGGVRLKQRAEAYHRASREAARAPLEKLQEEYFRIFGATISKDCPPYETSYGCSSFQQNIELSKIAGFYKAFGLEVQNTAGERLDYISAELEYMRFLCYKEAYGIEHRHDVGQIAVCVDAQKKFLGEHLGKWVFFFSKLLKSKAGDGYYGLLADLLDCFMTCELDYLEVSPEQLGRMEVTAHPSLEDSSCFSCGAGDECKEFPR